MQEPLKQKERAERCGERDLKHERDFTRDLALKMGHVWAQKETIKGNEYC